MKLNAIILILLITLIPFANAGFKEELKPKLDDIQSQYDLAKHKRFLPLTVKILSLDKREEFLVKISKEGKIEFLNSGKIDIAIYGNEKDLINVLNSDDKNIKENIVDLNFKGESLKGKIALFIAEKYSKVKLNKNKSFSDKVVAAVVYPITGLFIKN